MQNKFPIPGILLGVFLFLLDAPVAGQGNNWAEFIPPGYTLLDSAGGDLNYDSDRDLVIIGESGPDTANQANRTLLVLLKTKTGYNLVARNDNIVLCRGCGGAMGDPYQGIVIKKNYFSIEHYGGSSWRWERIITFRFDKTSKNFILHRDGGTSFHASSPEKTKEEKYHKERWGKTTLAEYTNSDW